MGYLDAFAHHAAEVRSSRTHNLWAAAISGQWPAFAAIYGVEYARQAPRASAQERPLSAFATADRHYPERASDPARQTPEAMMSATEWKDHWFGRALTADNAADVFEDPSGE
jgi:type 1 glutamine amidotransferase